MPPTFDAPPLPAFGDVMPRAVQEDQNSLILAPKIMPITFAGDANQADYDTFLTQYGASAAWTSQVSEYGIGAFTEATPQHEGSDVQPKTDAAVLALLHANLGPSGAWGQPDTDTTYMFFLPDGASFDDGTGAKCCSDYFGYHYDEQVNGVDVPYAIICACDIGGGPTELQVTTSTASHEAVEAVTDPYLDPVGFYGVDDDHVAWSYGSDPEIADLCQYADTQEWDNAPGLDAKFSLQRSWSNAAAAAGHDPCVGEGATPYYQTVPEAPDASTFDFSYLGYTVNTHLLKVPMNGTGTITLHVYADDPSAGPFTVTLGDLSFKNPAILTFEQPQGQFHAGDTITVPVTVSGTDENLGNMAEGFYVTTTPVSGPRTYYYGLVGQ